MNREAASESSSFGNCKDKWRGLGNLVTETAKTGRR